MIHKKRFKILTGDFMAHFKRHFVGSQYFLRSGLSSIFKLLFLRILGIMFGINRKRDCRLKLDFQHTNREVEKIILRISA